MTKILEFKPKEKGPAPFIPFSCSLNRALLTVQYCVYVLEDIATAQAILQQLTTTHDLGARVTLPGEFRDVVEHIDSAATYRAILGVRDE